MKGTIYHRCSCEAVYDAKGNRKTCPRASGRGRHGSWYYHLSGTVGGRRTQAKKGGFSTKREAEDALAEAIDALRRGVRPQAGALLVRDYLQDWLAGKVAAGLRDSTARSYRGHLNNYLIPHLGNHRLRELTALDVERAFRAIAESPARGAGPATVGNVARTLSSALGSAMRKRLVPFNVAKNVDLPRVARPRVRPWEPGEVGQFLDYVNSDPMGPLFEMMAMTGLRRGEALGLRWDDVDLEQGVIVVRQQLVEVDPKSEAARSCAWCADGHRSLQFGPPKTRSGEARQVDLDDATTGALLSHSLSQQLAREAAREGYVDHGLVFAQATGMPLQPDRVTKRFRQLAVAAGLRPIRLHDLRHGQASLMLAAGVDLSVVSKRMGHSSVALTADTYQHLLGGVGKAAANSAAGLVPRKPRYQSATSEAHEGEREAVVDGVIAGHRGGPPGDRTLNPRIKSPLLCRLS